ncbi:MAG: carboxypeptidase-like regulatory domain-containing protein [Bacteroidota bacterium]
MRKFTILTILFLTSQVFLNGQEKTKFTISGYVKEDVSNELLPGVTVFVPSLNTGVITNGYGFYSITLPVGSYDLIFNSVGFNAEKQTLMLDGDKVLNQFLKPSVVALDEVVVSAESQEKISESFKLLI